MQVKGLAKPKKRRTQVPSDFVMEYARLFASSGAPIADVGCGYGRNAKLLADLGCEIYCLDKNKEALADIATIQSVHGKLLPTVIDLATESWPFPPESLDGIINIHYYQADLIGDFIKALKLGGVLLLETISNQKGNYLQLPLRNSIQEQLSPNFEFLFYEQKNAGPASYNAVTVKVCARKINHTDAYCLLDL